MKKITLIMLLCIPAFLFSQSQLEVVGSLDVTSSTYGWNSIVGNIRNSNKAKLNTHFGVNYHQRLKSKLWLKLGIGFASLGFKDKKTNLIFGSQITGQGNDPLLPDGGFIQHKYNYHFLEIPIALRLDFLDKKWKMFSEFGISTMYYLQTVGIVLIDEGNGKRTTKDKFRSEKINQIQLATVLALGVSYKMSEKIEFILKPNFRYHFTKMAKSAGKKRLWSGGVALGARFSLK